jgi:hypothetical protein
MNFSYHPSLCNTEEGKRLVTPKTTLYIWNALRLADLWDVIHIRLGRMYGLHFKGYMFL